MTYRVTQRMMVEHSLTSLQNGLGRLARTQEQLSTGRVLNRPSDSPTDVNTAMRIRDAIDDQKQYARNAQDGLGWLGETGSTLTSMLDSVRRARDLTLQGASGSNDQTARDALATEVEQIRNGLVTQANASYLGRPLFGGTTIGQKAYDSDGSYVGDQGTVTRTVGDDVRVRVDVTGPEAFGDGADGLFGVLGRVAADLRGGDTAALSDDLTGLDDAQSQMRTTLADVGTRYNRVDDASQAAGDATMDLKTRLSDVENVDLAKATVDLQLQEVAYQAGLATTARTLQPSLMDFLR